MLRVAGKLFASVIGMIIAARRGVQTIASHSLLTVFVLAVCVTAPQASQRDGRQRSAASHSDYRVPAGTHLQIELRTNLSSSSNDVGDPVDGRLRLPLTAEGVELVPAGATLLGSVSEVEPAGKKRPGRLVFAFHIIEHPETGSRATIKGTAIAFASPRPKRGNVYPELKLEKGVDASVALLAPLTVRIPHSQ